MLQKIPVSVQNLDIRGNPLHPDGCHAWRQIHRLTQEKKILVDYDKKRYSAPAENWERLECDFEHQNNISGIISEQLTEVQTQTLHVLEKNNMVLSEIKTDVKELCKPDTHMTSLIICLLRYCVSYLDLSKPFCKISILVPSCCFPALRIFHSIWSAPFYSLMLMYIFREAFRVFDGVSFFTR